MVAPKKTAKLAISNAADKSREIEMGNAITRHICACGCGTAIALKDLLPVKTIGSGHASMKFYVRGHETRPGSR
jgi:hypothetical protein